MKTPKGLTAALGSPNLAVRAQAMAKLERLGLPAAQKVLDAAAVQKKNDILRARALWQLGRLGSLRFVVNSFADEDPRFRILAMRIFHDLRNQSPNEYIADWRARLLKDHSAAVRREALLLLRDVDPAKAKNLIYELAKTYDGKDRFFLEAVGIAVGHHDNKRREIILADFDKHFPEWNEKVAGLVWALRPPGMVPFLEKRLAEGKGTPEQRSQLVDILAGLPDAKVPNVLLAALGKETAEEVRNRILYHMKENLPRKWSALRQGPELHNAIESLLEKPAGKAVAVLLVGLAGKDRWVPEVIKLAEDRKESTEIRVASVRVLGDFTQTHAPLARLIENEKETKTIRLEAIGALGRHQNLNALGPLPGVMSNKRESLDLRQEAAAAVAASRTGSEFLLHCYQHKLLGDDLLTTDLARLLRNSPYPEIKQQAQRIFPAPPKLDPKNLPSIPALLARKGSINRGRDLMAATLKNDVACLKCHTINGQGGQVGPDLSVIGSKASRENLLESILYPSRAVADQYASWIVETKQGKSITGLIIEDGPEIILLRDADAKDYRIARKDIESRAKNPTSLMPDNLIQFMREEDLPDIVEYMYSLKNAAFVPAGR